MDELTKTFFHTFGIEPRHKCIDGALEPCDEQCNECGYYEFRYPQITDHILLGLIVVIMLHEDLYGYPRNIKDLKENVLKQLMETYNKFSSSSYEYQQTAKDIKHQVCKLFEGVNDDR